MNPRNSERFFSRWSLGRSSRSAARQSRRPLRARRSGLGSWERLGLGMGGMSHLDGLETLEQRALMAADLGITISDARVCYVPGTQTTYTVEVTNVGDATATDATVTTALGSKIAQKTWTAVYTGSGSGPASGTGDLNSKVTLPAGAKATFTVLGRIGADATGPLTSSASVSLADDVNAANDTASDTDTFVPKTIAVAADLGWGSTSLVRLVNPATGATVAQAFAYEQNFKTGVRVALADLDGSGVPHVVCVPNYGRVAEITVFRQQVAGDGTVTLVKDDRYSIQPFGPEYDGGLNLAVGDFDDDGRDDVAVSKSSGAGEVKVYLSTPAAASGPLTLHRSFSPYAAGFGGTSIAAGQFSVGTFFGGSKTAILGEGPAQLVVAGGPGKAPLVRIYSLATATPTVIDTIRPFAAAFRGGVSVSTARVNADAVPDVICAAGSGGGSMVEVYDGRVGTAANARIARFAAFGDLATRNAPVLAVGVDTDGDGRSDSITTAQGGAGRASLRRYSTAGALQGSTTGVAGPLSVAAALAGTDTNFTQTDSGLIYRTLQTGTGATPGASSSVRVNYEGRLLDGTRFDGNTNSSFTVGGVVAGFGEGLRTMKVGGRSQFIIPANLAYGGTARPGIPANSTLVFDVELLSTT